MAKTYQRLTGNRRVKGQAPDLLWPRFGRDVETLREEREVLEDLEMPARVS